MEKKNISPPVHTKLPTAKLHTGPKHTSFIAPGINSEVPNTDGVVIWPEKILNEIKILEQFDKAQRKRESHNLHHALEDHEVNNEEDFLVEKLGFSESFEFYLMLIVVSLIWWAGAYYVLKQHKFPFHKHYIEAAAIFVCPVIFIVVFFIIADRVYNYYDGKIKNKKDL
jgi:hypothetical protein